MSARSLSAVQVCEQAAAEIRRTMRLLEKRFVDEEEPEPAGWCPTETIYHLEQAIAMLEPLEDEAEESPSPKLYAVQS